MSEVREVGADSSVVWIVTRDGSTTIEVWIRGALTAIRRLHEGEPLEHAISGLLAAYAYGFKAGRLIPSQPGSWYAELTEAAP